MSSAASSRQTPHRSGAAFAEQAILRELGFTAESVERRKRIVGFTAEDARRIAGIKDAMLDHVEELTSAFFDYLAGLDEARPLLSNAELLARARKLKAEHLRAMVEGPYGLEYAEQRVRLGLVYGAGGLEARVFLGAFHELLRRIGLLIVKHGAGAPDEAFECFMSLSKIAFFDIAIIVDVIVSERERIIRQQQAAIRELSTPVLPVRERMLLLPIIGVIDTHRAQLITEGLLRSIRANRAKVVVMDVTGVAAIDSRVANHLLQTVAAAKLMGATVIVTGLSAEVAQSLVALGIDLEKLNTVGDLQGGMEEAERLLPASVLAGPHGPEEAEAP